MRKNFYRKVTNDDLSLLSKWYEKSLTPEARQLIKSNSFKSISFVRNENYCSLQEAKVIVDEYQTFLKVVQDLSEGKEIYTDY